MKRRVFAFLLTAIMLFSMVPAGGAFAQDTEELPEGNSVPASAPCTAADYETEETVSLMEASPDIPEEGEPAEDSIIAPEEDPEEKAGEILSDEELPEESSAIPEEESENNAVETEATPSEEEPQEESAPDSIENEESALTEELLAEELMLLGETPDAGTVRVTIANNTFPVSDGAAWDGVLADTFVSLNADSTMMSCVVDALDQNDYSQEGSEYDYITSINGLSAMDGGSMSGWMGTLNDWFTDEGLGAYTVAAGTLQDGDEIGIVYTCDFGPDCGGSWENNDKTLSSLVFSTGELIPAFDSSIHDYTLAVPAETVEITVTPTAANRNFQVHSFVGGTAFKRSEPVPVSDGTVISVIDGDPSWPSMNGGDYGTADSVPAEVYTVTVMYETGANVTVRSQMNGMNGMFLSGFDSSLYISSTTAERFGYADSVTGVSALDALVTAHELCFDGSFTVDMASEYLNVDGYGYISKIFGVETYANGFLLNGGYPNDGTESEWGGYNGTTVSTQQIFTGDILDFYIYGDAAGYSDYYTYLSLPEHIYAGREFTVNVSGTQVMSGYLYADASAFASAAVPVSGASFAWVNPVTGAVTVISGVCSDENGNAVLTAPEEGTYFLTAYGAASAPFCLMNPYQMCVSPIANLDLIIVSSPADAVVRVYDQTGTEISKNADGSYSGMFEKYTYTYTVTKYGYVSLNGTVPAQGGKIEAVLQEAPESEIEDVSSVWSSFRGNDDNMGITGTELPMNAEDTELLWAAKLGTGWTNAPSVQIIVDDFLVVMCGTMLYKLSLSDGTVLASGEMAGSPSWGYTPPTYAAGMIFCPLGNGTVQAFNASTLESLWVYTDVLGGQALSPISYCDGYIYTGFWTSYTDKASYVCLSVTDEDPSQTLEAKQASWRFVNDGGYYWAGALIIGDAVIFGSDDGEKSAGGNPCLYSINRLTGQPVTIVELDGVGDIRSTIAYDSDTSRIFFTTNDGYLCSAAVNAESGEISDVMAVYYNAKSTSTPVVYKGRVFFGTGSGISDSGSSGNFVIADAGTLQMLNYVELRGYPQCSALLSTAYEDEGFLCFYCTYNAMPGGITMIRVNTENSLMELTELYNAEGYEQYCITSLICDEDGTMYYKNDSGNVLAVGFSGAARTKSLIDAIGTVTADSADAITEANEAYLKLSEEDKAKVTNYSVLDAAIQDYELLLGNIAAVELSIDSIGTVTADSESAILDARTRYDALTDSEKEKITNCSVLTAAETDYSDIKAQITAVEKKISAIGTVNASSRNVITSARTAYDSLPESSKKYVSNYSTLTTAETGLSQYENAAEVIDLISAIGTVTSSSGSKITAVRSAYNALSSEEKKLVTNYSVLTAGETKYSALTSSSSSSSSSSGTTTTTVTKTVSTVTTANNSSGKTTVEINGKKYTVDTKAADLMTKICSLAERGNAQESEIISLYRTYSAMTEALKKQIYNYSDLEKLMDKLGERNHRDIASGISATGLAWNEKLFVSILKSGTEYGYIRGSIGNDRLVTLARVTFTDILTGKTLEKAAGVEISVPASKNSGETALDVCLFDNMELQRVSFSEEDGELIFKIQSGELFAVVSVVPDETAEEKEKTETEEKEKVTENEADEPKTVSVPLMWLATGGAGVTVLVSVLLIKLLNKRK